MRYVARSGKRHADDAQPIEKFQEKPNWETAAALIEAEGCYWNSGMFVFGARAFLRELSVYAPSIRRAVGNAHETAVTDLGFLRLDAESFGQSPGVSVDYAVMERMSNAWVVLWTQAGRT